MTKAREYSILLLIQAIPGNRKERENMKSVFLFPNEKKDTELLYTKRAMEYLKARGCRVYSIAELPGAESVNGEPPADLQFAVILGGDGTILRGAHYLLGTNTPILGVNLGTLGYMAEVEPNGIEAALRKVLEGDYRIEKRLVLEGLLTCLDTGECHKVNAMNEFVLHRNAMAGVLDVRAYINDTYIETYRTDGIIAATPNGSTAYNFSAGGPVLSPEAENLILTPLCSHSILDRSVVVTAKDRLSFEISSREDQEAPLFSADGIERIWLRGNYRLEVYKSEQHFPLIRVSDKNFFEILRTKMKR